MTTQNQIIQKTESKPATLKEWIGSDSFKDQVKIALPKHLTPERFIRIATTALMRVPKLSQCSQESVFKCLLDLSAMGLEPDGRRAHLIPFENRKTGKTECQLIVDYKGIVELIRRSGEVSYIHADVVCDNDVFEISFGTGGKLVHKPAFKNRGDVYCAYSYVKLKDGSEDFDMMSVDEIEAIHARSKAKDYGPWVTDWNEMAKKTVFRRHSKWLPLSPELRDKIEKDDEPLTEQEKFAASKPVFSSPQFDEPTQPKRGRKPKDAVNAPVEPSEPSDATPTPPDPENPQESAQTEPEKHPAELLDAIGAAFEQNNVDSLQFESWLKRKKKLLSTAQTLESAPVGILQQIVNNMDELIKEFSNQ